MKPYGKKKEKTRLGLHESDICGCEVCNNSKWKISKCRERSVIKTQLQLGNEETNELVLSSDDEGL